MKFLVLTTLLVIATLTLACASDDSDVPTPTPSLETPFVPPTPTTTQITLPQPTATSTSISPHDTPIKSPIPNQSATLTPEPTLRPPQPLPETSGHLSPEPYPFSLEQQIMLSDVIVLASFLSVAPGTETMSAAEGEEPTYRPVLTMNFRAMEYLKGTGPNEFYVELQSEGYESYQIDGQYYRGYLTQAAALQEAIKLTTARDTKYDDRPGILFLHGPVIPVVSPTDGGKSGSVATPVSGGLSSSVTTYGLMLHHRNGSFDYSVDTTSRAWLPAKNTFSGDASTGNNEFITDGTKEPPPVVSLSDVRTRIAEIDAMLKEGKGVEGWESCIYWKLNRKYMLSQTGEDEWDPLKYQRTLDSGVSEAVLMKPEKVGMAGYFQLWTKGPDGPLFKGVVIDNDTDPQNGYFYGYVASRPLPAGNYTVHTYLQHYIDVPCNYKPEDRYFIHEATVTAPAGTLHEAFFDPVESGQDEVSPAAFNVGGTATEITRLDWTDGKVVLSLDPIVSLDGYTLDFIELDGTASLNLRGSDVEERSRAGDGSETLKWAVADEPWEDGDKLMLRIREDGAAAPPTPEPGG